METKAEHTLPTHKIVIPSTSTTTHDTETACEPLNATLSTLIVQLEGIQKENKELHAVLCTHGCLITSNGSTQTITSYKRFSVLKAAKLGKLVGLNFNPFHVDFTTESIPASYCSKRSQEIRAHSVLHVHATKLVYETRYSGYILKRLKPREFKKSGPSLLLLSLKLTTVFRTNFAFFFWQIQNNPQQTVSVPCQCTTERFGEHTKHRSTAPYNYKMA